MSEASKVRVQLFDDKENYLGDADVQTSADLVYFSDGETFQQKLDGGKLKGETGDVGPRGPKGDTGDVGPKGAAGDKIRVGKTYSSATERNIFFKVLD